MFGTWTQSGDTVEVVYEPPSHHGSRVETYVTRGECTLIRTVRIDSKTGERIESPKTFTLDEPRCHPR